jgi:hypothetical protein
VPSVLSGTRCSAGPEANSIFFEGSFLPPNPHGWNVRAARRRSARK